jgi:hypothetical protein
MIDSVDPPWDKKRGFPPSRKASEDWDLKKEV